MIQTIIVPATGFISWGGGIDYLKYQLNFLVRLHEENPNITIILLIPKLQFVENVIQKAKDIIKRFIHRPIINYEKIYLLFANDNTLKNGIVIRKYYHNKPHGKGSIVQISYEYENTIVYLTAKVLQGLSCKQIGYIYDLQHALMPDFFKQKDCESKDKLFKNILAECNGVMVNSKQVKNDLLVRYAGDGEKNIAAQIFSFPCLPIAENDLLQSVDVAKYNLPEKYFMICNQLWMHKDHKTAFQALKILHDEGYKDICIICTGVTYDHRNPLYYQELKDYIINSKLNDNIVFLGYIPKIEQITILRKSIGLIQPTLFEGGPGGGASYDAVAYGIPAIVSDIPVNLEMQHENVFFFNAGSPLSLAEEMRQLFSNPLNHVSNDELLYETKNNLRNGVAVLKDLFCTLSES
ncbi:glycosyl transferase [Spirochaetia bacterium]|nr:glycosyl transferase [Spirochaetia bacterium]